MKKIAIPNVKNHLAVRPVSDVAASFYGLAMEDVKSPKCHNY